MMQLSSQPISAWAGLANSTSFIKLPKSSFSYLGISSPVNQLPVTLRSQRFVCYSESSRTLQDPLASQSILCSHHSCSLTIKLTPTLRFPTGSCWLQFVIICFYLNSTTLTQWYQYLQQILHIVFWGQTALTHNATCQPRGKANGMIWGATSCTPGCLAQATVMVSLVFPLLNHIWLELQHYSIYITGYLYCLAWLPVSQGRCWHQLQDSLWQTVLLVQASVYQQLRNFLPHWLDPQNQWTCLQQVQDSPV